MLESSALKLFTVAKVMLSTQLIIPYYPICGLVPPIFPLFEAVSIYLFYVHRSLVYTLPMRFVIVFFLFLRKSIEK